MLVLSRAINQEIRIGDNISIKILGRRGNRISIGVSAPQNVSVSRHEISVCKIEPRQCGDVMRMPLGPCVAE